MPESAVYNHMVVMERRVDSALQRKRVAITACLSTPETALRKIRLYIFNTHSSQQGLPGAPGAALWSTPIAMHCFVEIP